MNIVIARALARKLDFRMHGHADAAFQISSGSPYKATQLITRFSEGVTVTAAAHQTKLIMEVNVAFALTSIAPMARALTKPHALVPRLQRPRVRVAAAEEAVVVVVVTRCWKKIPALIFTSFTSFLTMVEIPGTTRMTRCTPAAITLTETQAMSLRLRFNRRFSFQLTPAHDRASESCRD